MAGYRTILQIRRLEEKADELGFMLAYPKHSFNGEYGDLVAIKPKDKDSLPVYSRDADIFTGTLDELETFFIGVAWSRQYDEILKLSDKKRRERKEQDYRNKVLAKILATGEVDK